MSDMKWKRGYIERIRCAIRPTGSEGFLTTRTSVEPSYAYASRSMYSVYAWNDLKHNGKGESERSTVVAKAAS